MEDHGLEIKRVLAQNYIDTYFFHHHVSEIVGPSRKPWRVSSLQLNDGLCNCTVCYTWVETPRLRQVKVKVKG